MNHPFGWEMEKSGVKTRPSEQTVLPIEADLLLGPDSSSEMDSETDAIDSVEKRGHEIVDMYIV